MVKIEFPEYRPKIKHLADKALIFDEIRKQWVVLTPEEWVRQNFLQYLVRVKTYPAALLAVEKEIQLGDLTKRFDIVVYNREMIPWMIVECKEMDVELNRQVLDQALRYNITLAVPYIVITNGSYCFCFSVDNSSFEELNDLPEFVTGER